MTTTLIVLARPGATSFCAASARAQAAATRAEAQQVLFSELYAQGFDPAERAEHYATTPDGFDPLRAQADAAKDHSLPTDVSDEIAKIRAAD